VIEILVSDIEGDVNDLRKSHTKHLVKGDIFRHISPTTKTPGKWRKATSDPWTSSSKGWKVNSEILNNDLTKKEETHAKRDYNCGSTWNR
jgi:hypothetical protein